ncbi:MAG: arylsulfatase [Pirellulaceae bacterium]|nr:arylsulfatase [Pirellulaceae bacterium]
MPNQTMWRIITAVLVLGLTVELRADDLGDTALPNIVVILADDLGYGDVGCYNPESRVPTPHLDRLAQQGMRFLDAHSPCTVCTPTRYGLLTGQMPFRIPGGGKVFTGAGGPSLIAKDRLTLPQMLKDAGYSTACFGKWHVGLTFFDSQGQPIHKGGLDEVRRIDYSRDILGGPLDCGFEQFFGTACCPTTDWLYAWIEGRKIPVPPRQVLDKTHLPKHPYSLDNRPGMVADDFDLENVDLKILEKSQRFLTEHVQNQPGKPFFLFHSTQAVHLPSFPAKPFQGKTDAGPHGDFIFELDFVVGELMKTLESLGIADNTLVIFTSDNGPEVDAIVNMRKDHEHDGARPWRGIKRDNWEGGHRVPFLVRWPGKIAAGTESDQMISLTDVMATAASVIGTTLPTTAAEDSFDLLPILHQKTTQPIRPFLLMQGFRNRRSLVIRKGNWKLMAHQGSGGNNYEKSAKLKPFQLPNNADSAPAQLYNLTNDPGETKNLFFTQREKADELQALLDTTLKNGRSRPQ